MTSSSLQSLKQEPDKLIEIILRQVAAVEELSKEIQELKKQNEELKQQIRELGHTLMHKPVRPMKLKTAMSHLLGRP